MTTIALFAFNGEPMCFLHVLLNALDMKARGFGVKLVLEGASVKLVPSAFRRVRGVQQDHAVGAGAVESGQRAFVQDAVSAAQFHQLVGQIERFAGVELEAEFLFRGEFRSAKATRSASACCAASSSGSVRAGVPGRVQALPGHRPGLRREQAPPASPVWRTEPV